MGDTKFFVCAFLLAAICKKTDGGIYDHNPFLNKVVISTPVAVKPVPTQGSPDAVQPAVTQAPHHHHQVVHVVNCTTDHGHPSPSVPVNAAAVHHPIQPNHPHIQPSVPQVQNNYPQIPSIFSQVPNDPNPSIVFHQPTVPPRPPVSTHQPLPPVFPTQPPVQPQLLADQTFGLRRLCLRARGQFPTGRCNTFVNCWDDIAVEQTCPPGLAYNAAGYCDYPQNVDCQGRQFVEVPVPQPEPTIPVNIQPLVEAVTAPPIYIPPVTVPVGLPGGIPSLPIQTQNPPVPEVVPAVSYIPVGNVPDPKLRGRCLTARGQFPSDSCQRYIDCWDDLAVEKECPPGLYFSEKGYCDHPYNVNCHNRTVIKTVSEPLCPAAEGTFRDKANCSRYYTCISSAVAAKYECPAGLNFNDVIGVCDYAYRVDCSREPFIYQPVKKVDVLQKVPAALMDATIECRPGRVFRLNPDCTSAALCRSGMTEVIHCPAGLAYDAPTDRCLPLQMARCQDN